MRGRLIFPFVAEIASLDTQATAAAGPADTGYDHDFHEPIRIDDGSVLGMPARAEVTHCVRVQVEPSAWDRMNMVVAGDARQNSIVLIAHFKELEDKGWVYPDGTTIFRVNDRLVAIREITTGNPIALAIPAVPGLYLRESLPLGFGFSPKRNLLQLDFRARVQARQ